MTSRVPLLRILTLLATLAVAGVLLGGFFGRLHPALDSLSHFRSHLAVALAAGGIILLCIRFRWTALAAMLFAAGALTTTLAGPGLGFNRAEAAIPASLDQPVYRLIQINLRWNHPEPERVVELLRRERPDIVTLEEVSPMWAAKLAELNSEYPYQLICRPNRFGSAILSTRPFVGGGKHGCHGRDLMATASVDFGSTNVDIGAIHLHWPWPYTQPRQIPQLAGHVSALDETAILAGDFNAATWSHAVAQLADAGKLTIVDGVGPTWIDYIFPRSMRWAGLPIDHVLVKGAVEPRRATTLEEVGSDHWPVLLEFTLATDRPA